jgi:hypothetical protein
VSSWWMIFLPISAVLRVELNRPTRAEPRQE